MATGKFAAEITAFIPAGQPCHVTCAVLSTQGGHLLFLANSCSCKCLLLLPAKWVGVRQVGWGYWPASTNFNQFCLHFQPTFQQCSTDSQPVSNTVNQLLQSFAEKINQFCLFQSIKHCSLPAIVCCSAAKLCETG